MTLRLIGQSEDAIHAHAHSSARLRIEEDFFSKITLKPLMHTKTHKKRTIFLNRETIPYFIFFWNRETDILRELGLVFLLRRKFVIVEVVYMIHTEMSRLLWLIKYDSSEKWVICRTSPRTDPFGYMLFCSFGMNLLCTKRNEACDSSVFRTWTRGLRTVRRTYCLRWCPRDWQFPRFRIG